jgi:hypothetical protein
MLGAGSECRLPRRPLLLALASLPLLLPRAGGLKRQCCMSSWGHMPSRVMFPPLPPRVPRPRPRVVGGFCSASRFSIVSLFSSTCVRVFRFFFLFVFDKKKTKFKKIFFPFGAHFLTKFRQALEIHAFMIDTKSQPIGDSLMPQIISWPQSSVLLFLKSIDKKKKKKHIDKEKKEKKKINKSLVVER